MHTPEQSSQFGKAYNKLTESTKSIEGRNDFASVDFRALDPLPELESNQVKLGEEVIKAADKSSASIPESLPAFRPTEQQLRNFLRGYSRLSHREMDVLGPCLYGASQPEVAKLLGISAKTVKSHIGNIYNKLGVRNLFDILHLAYAVGYIGKGNQPVAQQDELLDLHDQDFISRQTRAESASLGLEQRQAQDFLRAFQKLSQTERQVALLTAEGMTNREIGVRLKVVEATIKHYSEALFQKLNVGNRTMLTRCLYRFGVLGVLVATTDTKKNKTE